VANAPLTAAPATSLPAARRRAFTLTELLVVVAILGVLASLLLPYFGRAREQARLTICRGNLRSLGLGLNAYVATHRRHVPLAEKLDNPHRELIDGLHGRFVGKAETFYCPSETRPELRFSEANFQAANIGYFYFCCRRATPNRAVSTFLRWDVEYPRILDTRMTSDAWVASDAWFGGEPTAHRWYDKGVNYLTLGGDVRMIHHQPRAAFR